MFLLAPEITFLNFGSFGALPREIYEAQQRYILEMEANPVQFIAVHSAERLKNARAELANYIHCNTDDVTFVTNPSYAANIITKSLDLKNGDEVLTTNLEYGGLDRAWNQLAKWTGAKIVRQPVTLPIESKEKFVDDFFKGFSAKTRIVFISHITSSTALKLPVKEICAEAKRRGVLTIVDGAHVPGHIPLDLQSIEADMYIGACHKWMMTPKGSSFLYVKKEYQALLDPLVVSWGYESDAPSASQFIDYHEMQGTRDFTAFLTIPDSIAFMKKNDWWAVAKKNAELAQSNYQRFCSIAGSQPLCPISNEWLGQMCSIPITTNNPMQLKERLFNEFKIEIPVMPHLDKVYLRYSIQAFNTPNDLDKLEYALKKIL